LERVEEEKRRERVKEIDRLIVEGQQKILDLQCKKDELQRRPNPLYNYTKTSTSTSNTDQSDTKESNTRTFNFPSDDLVNEYIDELFSSRRLIKLNHTDLWRKGIDSIKNDGVDDDDIIGDDFVASSDTGKSHEIESQPYKSLNNMGGGSWLLRQTLGKGGSLGEKIGEAAEKAAYSAVCKSVMELLAKSLAALHGVNVMTHSDIRLIIESSPDLPPSSRNNVLGNTDYARTAINRAIHKGSKKKRKKKSQHKKSTDDDSTNGKGFIQRDAVVETLISHCQISAPLLKLFPHAWQRAMLGNIITLICAVVSDFCDGVQFQILGHQLSFNFKPITEADMIKHIGLRGYKSSYRRSDPEEFEATVRATADDISESLAFLDRWHERALGGDLLRAQIGNLIARIVLTLVEEVLSEARMDLWSVQVGGPRILAGLEYRPNLQSRRTQT